MESGIELSGAGLGVGVLFTVLAVTWGVAVTIFWMMCAWRAMRAHEKLAVSVDALSRQQLPPGVQGGAQHGPQQNNARPASPPNA